MRARTFLIALPLAALAIAGCGGGGGSDSTASTAASATTETTALSKEELISQGDAVCAEVNAAVGTVGASSAESSSQVSQVADLYTGMVESLKNLGAPEDPSGYSEFIAAAEELSTAEGEAKLAEERGDSAALSAAETKSTSALASFQSAAESYGFKECSEAPSAPPSTSAATTPSAGEPESAESAETPEVEAAPEVEPAPETGGAGSVEAGGGSAGGGTAGGSTEGSGGGSSSGGIGPG
jgi:hypothetical protein